MLVKNPDRSARPGVRYSQVADYLSAGQKLTALAADGTFLGAEQAVLTPDDHGDWLTQRTDAFAAYTPLGAKHEDTAESGTIFALYGRGLETGRDAWIYQSSSRKLMENIELTVEAFNQQIEAFKRFGAAHPGQRPKDLVTDFVDLDASRISWTLSLRNRLAALRPLDVSPDRLMQATYRPFFKQLAYFDAGLNHIRGQTPRMFPRATVGQLGIYQVGMGSAVPFSVLALNTLPDLHVTGAGSGGQFFPRWRYEPTDVSEGVLFEHENVVNGYRRLDNVSDAALEGYEAAYPRESITKDDIFFYVYGLLNSPEYRETYAADLKKMLPRIPFVEDFRGYADAGRKLSDLHLGYESVAPYPLDGLDAAPPAGADAYDFYRVQKMRFPKKGELGSIVYNDHVTVSGVPEDAYRYMLGSRSAVEWIIDRYQIKTDKPSGIVNDPNDWSCEVGDPRYILDLLARIVTVSLETMRVVDSLPPLSILFSHTSG